MTLGIFAKTFARPTLEDALAAVAEHGFEWMQFNYSICGLPSLPESVPDALIERIHQASRRFRLRIAAVSGTFNMIHPDPAERREGLRRLEVIAASCPAIGASVLTLCTGTRDAQDMWRAHPANQSEAAWDDLRASIATALRIAERHQVVLAIEPEVANVVDSAHKARRLLDEFQSPRLKIVIDAANLLHPGDLPRQNEILQEAVALLAPDILLAHAKDVERDGGDGVCAAGLGALNFPLYLDLLHTAGYTGPLILHGLREDQVAASRSFLLHALSALRSQK